MYERMIEYRHTTSTAGDAVQERPLSPPSPMPRPNSVAPRVARPAARAAGGWRCAVAVTVRGEVGRDATITTHGAAGIVTSTTWRSRDSAAATAAAGWVGVCAGGPARERGCEIVRVCA